MKLIIISLCIVIAAAIWFCMPADLAFKATQSSPSHTKPSMPSGTPAGQPAPLVASESTPPQSPMNDLQQAAKSIANKNRLLLQMSDKGELVGKPIELIAKLVGTPTSVEDHKMVYRLDTGFGGFEWRFEHAKGIVTSVVKTGID